MSSQSSQVQLQGAQWGSQRKRQEPQWVWSYKQRQESLSKINFSLRHSKHGLTKAHIHDCNMQLIHLDYLQGATPSSPGTPWFQPEPMVQLNPCLFPGLKISEFFKTHEKIRLSPDMAEEECGRLLGSALASEFSKQRKTARINGERPSSEYLTFVPHEKTIQRLAYLPGNVRRMDQSSEEKSSHRIITLEVNEPADQLHPSVHELETLVIFLRDAMIDGAKAMRNPRHRPELLDFHHTFPTLIVSIYHGAQARVLYGSFDGNQLEVQYTDVQQFTEVGFYDQIKGLLSWSLPFCLWDTTTIPRMASIIEEDESGGCSTPEYEVARAYEPAKEAKTHFMLASPMEVELDTKAAAKAAKKAKKEKEKKWKELRKKQKQQKKEAYGLLKPRRR
ncbi:uncharacterized protein N7484_008637 [Penicillium longicatenatum]|uniref:uncharacterized protein n=1 Tax=Penicillium longicatenatum TaxID=1561947 RepID=UPI002547AB73|nr:uncharacterized protein N7484_008637 [Penicillium longicatenatum]KAJ5635324.1 hypothetical protein N7484_008637 [Penicillium longicatenatum]